MREILFRGQTASGVWVEGDLIINTANGLSFSYIRYRVNDFNYSRAKVDPDTVGQFTGLTDKNGKKIFEGDIVRADDYIFSIKYGKCGGTPNADNYGYMGFYLEAVSEGTKICAKYGLRDDMCYFEDIEIIDNIHDNQLLLKGGE